MGPKTVVITNGSNGVYVATEKEIIFHPSIKTKVVDTVGAGDSWILFCCKLKSWA